MENRKIRVLIAKVGLDGHDRGAKIVAHALKSSGMEVVYTGLRQTVDQVVNAAIQEDVDVLGMSFLSGDHMVLVPKVMKALKEKCVEDLMVVVGGIILKKDIPGLLGMGVSKVFLPGTPKAEIVKYIQENAPRR
ncbi:MAG: cobalamin B12-binding domain-containing protein [Deltaproteobacteria bacterium]|nr:cobalamin B12-binding domain-containing protein [Deltaproteobacteria bacterium]